MTRKLITIKEASKKLGVSMDTLRRWDKEGNLKAVRLTPKGHRKYFLDDIEIFVSDIFLLAKKWAYASDSSEPAGEFYCPDSLVFQSRADKLLNELKNIKSLEQNFSLITSVVGEIGNNSFDHNLGSWIDVRGIFFAYDLNKKQIVLADRGRGLLATLKKVRPELSGDEEALKMAFTERISGRAPESRGNGLKYVRKVITQLGQDLYMKMYFQSGDSALEMQYGDKDLKILKSEIAFHGCLAYITFN